MAHLRHAVRSDKPALAFLIESSVRGLQRASYTPVQIELALANLFGVDTMLIDDRTYFLIEDGAEIVACGGWSRRATLFGGDDFAGRTDAWLDPAFDAAKIRAFFVGPSHARRGLASLLLDTCEREAIMAGFRWAELAATLTGVAFYSARGYRQVGRADISLPAGESLPVVRMERMLP